MTMDYSARLYSYIPKDSIPLYVEAVPKGAHPARMFHDHNFSEFVLILSGEAQHLIGEKSCTVRAGDVLILHPGIRHAYDRTGNLELINIAYDSLQLSMPILDGYMLPLFHKIFPSGQYTDWDPCAPVSHLDDQEREAVAAKVFYLQEVLNSTRPGKLYLALAVFMEIMAQLGCCDVVAQEKHLPVYLIGEIIGYMNKHLSSRILLDDLLKTAGMSRRNLFRHFKMLTGCTPQGYLLQLRLKRATELLTKTTLNISEIALQCGFYDSNYFCRLFRQHCNTSPKRFRENHINFGLQKT